MHLFQLLLTRAASGILAEVCCLLQAAGPPQRPTAPCCLPTRDAARAQKAASVEARLALYARVAGRQYKLLSRHLKVYRPWREAPVVGLPDPGTTEDILRVADCAWELALSELEHERSGRAVSVPQLLSIHRTVARILRDF